MLIKFTGDHGKLNSMGYEAKKLHAMEYNAYQKDDFFIFLTDCSVENTCINSYIIASLINQIKSGKKYNDLATVTTNYIFPEGFSRIDIVFNNENNIVSYDAELYYNWFESLHNARKSNLTSSEFNYNLFSKISIDIKTWNIIEQLVHLEWLEIKS